MRKAAGERLGDRGADVVRDDDDGCQSEMLDQAGEVIRMNLGGISKGRQEVGLVAIAEAPQIRGDNVRERASPGMTRRQSYQNPGQPWGSKTGWP